jgi:hypothetical protein
MKLFVSALALFITLNLFGQVKEGYFQYSIDVRALDTTAEARKTVAMLMNSQMEIYFSDNRYRVDFKMGQLYTTSVRVDRINNKAISLSDTDLGKFATEADIEALDAASPNTFDTNAVVTLIDIEKEFLGFKCKKAEILSYGKKSIYWYTNEIDVDQHGQTLINPNVPGFPLAFSTKENGILMTYQVSNYSFDLEDKDLIFSTEIPEGEGYQTADPNGNLISH